MEELLSLLRDIRSDLRILADARRPKPAPEPKALKAVKWKNYTVNTQPGACYRVLLGLAGPTLSGVPRDKWLLACLEQGYVPAENSFRASLSRLAAAEWISVAGPYVQPRWPARADGSVTAPVSG